MEEYDKLQKASDELPHDMEDMGKHYVYQYRNFKSFWAILKSDSFWVTNARFCNDIEEQRFGAHVLDVVWRDTDNPDTNENTPHEELDENYIACFCKENNKLSQWRGYAPEGGCSIGFDFNMANHYRIISEKKEVEQISQLCAVLYLPAQGSRSDKDYANICVEHMTQRTPGEGMVKTEDARKERKRRVPFIKHADFSEEDEYRLVFKNEDKELDDLIHYRQAENPAIQIPYIIVKAGQKHGEKQNCVVRIALCNKCAAETLIKELRKKLPQTQIHICNATYGQTGNVDATFCNGCGVRRWLGGEKVNDECRFQGCSYNAYGLAENENCVMISQGKDEERIYKVVHACVEKINHKYHSNNDPVKVWCEGHLPIRSIMVGPCENQSSVKESIRQYCKHTYWLQDVVIETSTTPFRKSI